MSATCIIVLSHNEERRIGKCLASLPLGEPVSVPFRYTSPYGIRIDPFTKRPSPHMGVDMAAYRDAPIVTTGPGKVSYAGARSGYGLLVEVDHGHGFKSRYGHLRSITVSKLGLSRFRVGGMTWSRMARTQKAASMAPAAPSRWPVIDFVELTARFLA